MKTLYRKNVTGVGSWRIWGIGGTVHIAHCTVLGGAEVFHTENVAEGKQGRTLHEQVTSRINSRIGRMRDKGYKDSIDEARTSSNTNQLGLLRPMLAQPIDKVSSVMYDGAVLQKKLNGHRCLVTKQEHQVIPYSRLGKAIPAIKHIIKSLESRLPEDVTIDGELYVHGAKLQSIASWVKAEQTETYGVSLVLYDLVSNDSYVDRHAELIDIVGGTKIDTGCVGSIFVLPYESAESLEHAVRHRDKSIDSGFEGSMLRLANRPYQVGIRSSSLLKVKKFHDAEFRVLDVIPSEKSWGICVCELPNGSTFKTSAPGTMEEKTDVLMNRNRYIGRMLTVEYAELTADGIPFHCSATGWREDV